MDDKIQELSRQIEELRATAQPSKMITLPMAIVLAGVLIAGSVTYASILYRNGNAAALRDPAGDAAQEVADIRPVAADDHIFGDQNALVKIVEYSDTECPFCKRFHQTMRRIMVTYGADGRVAWVYRHLPLSQLHAQAPVEAHAAECADEIGGNNAFWKYINILFDITPSNDGLDLAQLPVIAQDAGLTNVCKATNALIASSAMQKKRLMPVFKAHRIASYLPRKENAS